MVWKLPEAGLKGSRELKPLAASVRYRVTEELYWPLLVLLHTYQSLQ